MGALAKSDMGDQKKGNRNVDVQISDKATFEEAIVATGFGKFNIILMIFIIPSSFSQASEQMGISYVLPVAECDLNLSLAQKGMLSAITFAGMISSGPFMGVVCDAFGRRKLIIYGYFVHTICTLLAATSTTVMQLFVAKFLCGFVFNGPFSAVTTYLSEFHSSEYRARVQIIRGITYATGFFILPLVAWLVLPLDLDYELFGSISIHSWNVFLLCCALSPLLASGMFIFMPESPKFLMSAGKNKEALEVFQRVYSMNSGKPKNDFPVKTLVSEINESIVGTKKTFKGSIKEGWLRISPIFMPPYLYRLILASTVAMIVLCGLHTIKLWLPQILQLANDYQQEHNGTSTNVCAIIDILKNKKEQSAPGTCQVNTDNSFVYINSLIVNGAEIIVFFISGFIVNWIGKTRLMLMLSTIASICAIGIYFAANSLILVVLSTIYIPALDLTGVMAVTITLEMFPTHFRTIAVSFHLMSARIGSLTANLLFPVLVATSCLAPFLFCCLLCADVKSKQKQGASNFVMRLDYAYLVIVTYFVQLSEGGGGHKKHVHVKINVPILVHKHKHIITVYKKPHKVEPKKHIVIHKHIHNHGHNHGHKHKHKHDHKAKVDAKHDHKHKHKHDHKHKHKHSKPHGHHDHGHHEHHGHKGHHGHEWHHGHEGHGYDGHHDHYENKDNEYDLQRNPGIPGNYFDDDGFTSAKKSLKTEHIEVTHVDPLATNPRDRLKVRGSYKVQESDPYDITTTSYQAYDSPFGKEIAKKLTNFRENIKENDDDEPDGINNYENYDDGAEDLENLILTPEDENNDIGYYQGREKSEHYVTNERYK